MFKINNKNTRTRNDVAPGVFIVKLEQILHLLLVFIVEFEQKVSSVRWRPASVFRR